MTEKERSKAAGVARRGFFAAAGTGVLAGAAGLLAAGRAEAQEPRRLKLPKAIKKRPGLRCGMWLHGTAVRFEERPDRIHRVRRGATGTRVDGLRVFGPKAVQPLYFDFAIPTPVIVDDVRYRVKRAIFQFQAGIRMGVQGLVVVDGTKVIAQRGWPWLERLTGKRDFEVLDVPGTPEVQFGLLLRVMVSGDPVDAQPAKAMNKAGKWTPARRDRDMWIHFKGAGVDFV